MSKRLGKLRKEIERKREEMIAAGQKYGLNHPETIRLSQELDKLLNKAMLGGGK